MFKIPTATLITMSGLLAAGLLLIALTGENVSSSMDAMQIISFPGIVTTIPSVPGVPTIPMMAKPTATPTPTPQLTPPARYSPPESIPGLVRVTEVPSPTPVPTPASTEGDIVESPAYLPTTTPAPIVAPTVVERSLPSTWLIIGLIAAVGAIFVVFGVYSVFRRRK
jgi:hypothetical protein